MPESIHPVAGTVYTVAQIDKLNLSDSPFYYFFNESRKKKVVQTSHMANNLSDLPGFSDIRFTFIRITNEWIPIFEIVREDNSKFLDLLQSGKDQHGETFYWPKASDPFL